MKYFILLLSLTLFNFVNNTEKIRKEYFPRQEVKVSINAPNPNNWIFFLAGQSNMAGRAQVAPQDTIIDHRLLSINNAGETILAKAPLHFYEPSKSGLGCGRSFGQHLLKTQSKEINIILIPIAVGGSTIEQWLNDDYCEGIKLFSNFKEKVRLAKQWGVIKGILWHQGESNSYTATQVEQYPRQVKTLFQRFRYYCQDNELPIIMAELGNFNVNRPLWKQFNAQLTTITKQTAFCEVVSSHKLKDKGDKAHFDASAQRELGIRYAKIFLKYVNP